MATVTNAIASLQLNNTPYWWLYNGSGKKVGQYLASNDLESSTASLMQVYELLPDGTYTVKATDKEQNHSGANHFTFTKSNKNQSTQPVQMQGNSLNPGGVSDDVYNRIKDEVRFKMKVENLLDKMETFFEEWPDYKKKIDRLWDDEDGDGTPDFLEMTKKVGEAVNAGKEIKGFFK